MVVSLYSRKELTFSYSQKAVSAITTNSSGPPGRWLRWSRHHTRGRGSPSKLLDKLESRSGHSPEKYVKSATQMNISSFLVSPFSLFFCLFQDISGVDWRRNMIFVIALFFWFLSTMWVPPLLQLEGSMPECPLELSPKNKTENGRSFLKSAAGCDAAATQTMACSFSEQIAFQAL